MKAAVLREVGKPMAIEEVQIAEPAAQEVLVRVKAVGLCHSDLHVIDGHLPSALPIILGHEAAGIVERVGSAVTNVQPGDHVIANLVFHCGHCAHCLSGHPNRCMPPDARRAPGEPPRLSAGGVAIDQFCGTGSFAEFMLVHASGCVPIRKDMPFDCACLISCGVTTGFGAATRTANVQPGETVAVIGCGGVGLAAVNGAAVAGARRIIAIDRVPMKLDMARSFGATDVINAADTDPVVAVMALTDAWGVDHAIEAIGMPATA
jgi:S-(hydroxymethyl)glutathione dehydrogenase/alcohol dehydrogenase